MSEVDITDVTLACDFHETYERLAPQFGYCTRKDSAVPWPEVPEQNRRLMAAVAAEIIERHIAPLRQSQHADPFERAGKIRRGELDDEMPDYKELTGWLQRIPMTWLPGILRRVVGLCVMRGCFKEGGLEHTVAAAKKVGEDPQGSILRT